MESGDPGSHSERLCPFRKPAPQLSLHRSSCCRSVYDGCRLGEVRRCKYDRPERRTTWKGCSDAAGYPPDDLASPGNKGALWTWFADSGVARRTAYGLPPSSECRLGRNLCRTTRKERWVGSSDQ